MKVVNETKKILASYVKLLTIDTVELFRGLIDERTFERDLKQRWEIKAVDKFVDMTFFKSQYDKKTNININWFLKRNLPLLRHDDEIRKSFEEFSKDYRSTNKLIIDLEGLKSSH